MKISSIFKHTAIYGLATVLPRVLNLILTPLHIANLTKSQYGIYQGIFAYMILGNVLLTYGMETAFFRFMNKDVNRKQVESTALTSIVISTLFFFIIFWSLKSYIATWINFPEIFVQYAILILVLDTLVVIPFAWFRNCGKSIQYTIVKISNVTINLLLNLFFFLIAPILINKNATFWSFLQVDDKIHYVFISNLIASLCTFLFLLPSYIRIKFGFSFSLWKKMFQYAFPVLIAGIAFSINEASDRVFIRMYFPEETADAIVGIYSACYKMGVFMTLFITAYKLGVEPFFFNTASDKNAPKTYAKITRFFIIFACIILLFVSTFVDIFKRILISDKSYWEALDIVPFILIANLCLGIYHSLSVWYKITDKTIYGTYISIIGGVITIVFNPILIPIIGYKGSAITTLLAYGSMMIISYIFGQKNYPIPYNLRKINLYLIFSISATFINFYVLNRNIFVGIISLVFFLFLVYFSEKRKNPNKI